MNNKPTVSVIIPCFNMGDFVLESIDSALSQTYKNIEIIVVNDGSTDEKTNEILKNLDRPNTIVINTANRGLAAARNLAIQSSRGKYICALDADDMLHPRFLEKTITILESQPEIAFVSTWFKAFGIESWVWKQRRCDLPALLAECVVLTASPVKREAIDAVGGYDENMPVQGDEDWDLWISLVERGFSGTIIPEVLFYYRQRHNSMRRMCTMPRARMQSWGYLLEKHKESYISFAPEVLLLKEKECGNILLDNWKIENSIAELSIRAEKQRTIKERLEAAIANVPEVSSSHNPADIEHELLLRGELERAHNEISALRSSYSWRITEPLRIIFDRYLALKRFFKNLSN